MYIIEGHRSTVYSICFSYDNQKIASSDNKNINIWNLIGGFCIVFLNAHENNINSICFSSNG
jgi:WD40 repeat protein